MEHSTGKGKILLRPCLWKSMKVVRWKQLHRCHVDKPEQVQTHSVGQGGRAAATSFTEMWDEIPQQLCKPPLDHMQIFAKLPVQVQQPHPHTFTSSCSTLVHRYCWAFTCLLNFWKLGCWIRSSSSKRPLFTQQCLWETKTMYYSYSYSIQSTSPFQHLIFPA